MSRYWLDVLDQDRHVQRTAFGEADKGGHVQPQRARLQVGQAGFAHYAGQAHQGVDRNSSMVGYSIAIASTDSTSSSIATSVPDLALSEGAV